jgi:hypothetical protein
MGRVTGEGLRIGLDAGLGRQAVAAHDDGALLGKAGAPIAGYSLSRVRRPPSSSVIVSPG